MHRKVADEKKAITGSNPVHNLGKAISAGVGVLTLNQTPVDFINQLYKEKKDEHGNIWIGLDNKKFSAWRHFFKYSLGHSKIFQPILIPTNPAVIDSIIRRAKDGKDADFAGNQSTDLIANLAGRENIFAAKDATTHNAHKTQFLKFLQDSGHNVECAGPIIKQWIKENSGKTITENNISTLCARLMLAFLLNPDAANKTKLVEDIQVVKSHFVKEATTLSEKMFGLFNYSYNNADTELSTEIAKLYHSKEDSYPKVLANSKFTVEKADSHIRSLMMVGFDNLLTCLTQTIYRLAEHPELHTKLLEDVQNIRGFNFVDFNLGKPENKEIPPNTFSRMFFAETMRLNPPVFLQARKTQAKNVTIKYEEKGEPKSFNLHAGTLVLVPVYQLAREMEHGNDFRPERERPKPLFPFPFSIGNNNCPGRNIGYASAGVLVGELLNTQKELQLLSKPKQDPQVALVAKDMQIKLVPKVGPVIKEEPVKEQEEYTGWLSVLPSRGF